MMRGRDGDKLILIHKLNRHLIRWRWPTNKYFFLFKKQRSSPLDHFDSKCVFPSRLHQNDNFITHKLLLNSLKIEALKHAADVTGRTDGLPQDVRERRMGLNIEAKKVCVPQKNLP